MHINFFLTSTYLKDSFQQFFGCEILLNCEKKFRVMTLKELLLLLNKIPKKNGIFGFILVQMITMIPTG